MADNISRVLSDPAVRNAKPAAKPYKLADGGGLFLLVQPNGAKLWRYKYRLHGAERLMALGTYPDVTLAAARNAHRAARAQVAAGENPVQVRRIESQKARQAELQAKTGAFQNLAAVWGAITAPKLAANTIRQRDRELDRHLLPTLGHRNVAEITRMEVSALLRRVEARAPEVARNLRNYLSGIFEHAIDTGVLSASPVPPPRILKRRQQRNHKAMSVDDLPQFLLDVRACNAEPTTKAAMQLVILTACRKAEVAGARWEEFDLDAAEWLIPAERMKARREHWVPLSRQAVAILRELRRQTNGAVLFPHRDRPGAHMAERTLNMMLQRMDYAGETIHGFRSVFSTHFNQLGVNPDVVERCLAHAPRDKVRAAYNRHQYREERRKLMQDWADYLDGLLLQKQAA